MQKLKVIVDNRERNIEIITGLEDYELEMTFAQLPVGDYIISDRIGIERKTVSDFESSIVNSRLFDQAERLHAAFKKPILLIEGGDSERRLKKNVMLGTITKLYVDYNIQVMRTESAKDTAYTVYRFAEHEQAEEERFPRAVGLKKAHSTYQWQLLILGSIPGIGSKLAQRLITHFKSIRGVMSADVEELKKVEKIGPKKAEKIYDILNAKFEGA